MPAFEGIFRGSPAAGRGDTTGPVGRAMNEFIEIRGARENNLKDVSLRIPKRQITIFTGVSGSGKSSIVFDTIATEAQRQLYENFSLFVRSFLPRYPPPEADAIENLSMAVIVDQKRLGGGSHSTVGTITDIYTLLRLLFSRVGKPHVGYSNAFSFNDPAGHVPRVQRPRQEARRHLPTTSSTARSRSPKAPCRCRSSRRGRAAPTRPRASSTSTRSCRSSRSEEMDLLLHSKPRKVKMRFGDSTMNVTFMGIVEKIERAYIRRDLKTLSERTQKAVAPYLRQRPCPACKGARLSQAALGCKIDGRNIAELSAMEIGELLPVVQAITDPVGAPIVASARRAAAARGRHRPRLPDPQSRDRHALGRRIAAHQDGETPRQQPRRRHVHLRRAERRAAPARRAPPQRAAAEAARQGQHRDRRRARSRRDQDRRSRRRRRPARGHGRRTSGVRGQLSRPACVPTR